MAVQQLHWHIDFTSLENTSVFKTECVSEMGESSEVRQLKQSLVSAIRERQNYTSGKWMIIGHQSDGNFSCSRFHTGGSSKA